MIRAKMRCLHLDFTLANKVTVTLLPVLPKRGLPNFEENKQFWEASPSGKADLTYIGGVPILDGKSMFEVGSFYFVDIEKVTVADDAPGFWDLDRREEHLKGTTTVELRSRWRRQADPPSLLDSGFVQIGLSDSATGAKAAFGGPSFGWTVTTSFAHGEEVD